jgi:hypothetical protein
MLYIDIMEVTQMTNERKWVVVNRENDAIVAGPFKSHVSAYRKADKLDLQYGEVHYAVREA